MTRIALTVNGKPVEAEISPRTHLADFLRERLNLTGTHLGCEHGVCGACTVEMNGAIVRSCITYAVACDGADIRTIESFDDDAVMEQLRSAFSSEHALQCGYCTPGMLITARDLVRRKQGLSEKQIRQEMSGNLCRCTGYVGIVNAIQDVMAEGVEKADTSQPSGHLGPAPGPGAPGYAGNAARNQPARDKPSKRPAPPVDAPPRMATKIDVIVGKMSERDGFTEIPQHFTLPHAREKVWALMSDLQAIADAMPGAELEDMTDNQITGRMSVKLGPMRPSFAGQATFERNDAEQSMEIEGSGRDKSSASSARGRIVYSLSEAEDGAATRVDVTISYKLAGMLAQFGRGEIVRDVIQRLAAVFAQNIDARLSGTASSANEMSSDGINAFALIWSIIKARIAAIFKRDSDQT
jgi:carbon-monoxide dehydrogenase small subunit